MTKTTGVMIQTAMVYFPSWEGSEQTWDQMYGIGICSSFALSQKRRLRDSLIRRTSVVSDQPSFRCAVHLPNIVRKRQCLRPRPRLSSRSRTAASFPCRFVHSFVVWRSWWSFRWPTPKTASTDWRSSASTSTIWRRESFPMGRVLNTKSQYKTVIMTLKAGALARRQNFFGPLTS